MERAISVCRKEQDIRIDEHLLVKWPFELLERTRDVAEVDLLGTHCVGLLHERAPWTSVQKALANQLVDGLAQADPALAPEAFDRSRYILLERYRRTHFH